MKRRSFITKAVTALAAAPLLAKAALTRKEPTTGWVIPPLSELTGRPPYGPVASEVMDAVCGPAIKVPSNRTAIWERQISGELTYQYHAYDGNWDGTFKLERGCTNPAYILADLYERTGEEGPDWVAGIRVWRSGTYWPYMLNWQMLYDWGRWADEMVSSGWTHVVCGPRATHSESNMRPRMDVALVERTARELEMLREDLRMHCLSWQSTDPRYRTSWPGIPYPEERA